MEGKNKKKWTSPKVQEVQVKEDSTSIGCQGKKIGCYAGSSCGSVKREETKPRQKPKK